MVDEDFRFTLPDRTKIPCTHCKYQATMEWEGKIILFPAASSCEKYPKDAGPKPRGILYPIYDVSKHETPRDGHYIKCPFYEPETQK